MNKRQINFRQLSVAALASNRFRSFAPSRVKREQGGCFNSKETVPNHDALRRCLLGSVNNTFMVPRTWPCNSEDVVAKDFCYRLL